MFKSIPASAIVDIVPSALSAGGTPLALNGALIVKGLLDTGSTVREVTRFDNFKEIFNAEDLDTVNSYFNSVTIATQTPDKLFVTVKRDADYGAVLSGVKLEAYQPNKGASLSLDVVIDGTRKEATAIDYDAAGSYSNLATLISAQIEATVRFDEPTQRFIVESATTGTQSTITTASGTLAEALGLTDTQGAVAINGGIADTSISDALDRIFNYTQNWGGVTTSYSMSEDEALDFAKWINNQGNRFWGVIWTLDPKATQDQPSIGTKVIENNFSGVTCVYGDARYATAALSYMASINFSELNGRMTLDFKTQSGLPAVVTDASTANMLERNGYMFYGAYATVNDRFIFFRNSVVSGPFEWVDTYLNQIYLNAQLQLSALDMLLKNKSVPYNAEGDALITGSILDPVNEMLNFGGIQTGVQMGENQARTINRETGVEADKQIFDKGFFFRVGRASAQTRGARKTPPLKLWYADGGSVHEIDIASIAVL